MFTPILTLLSMLFGIFKKHWKIIVVMIIVIVAYLWHQKAVIDYGNTRFQQGVDVTLTKVKEQVEELNVQHRDKEQKLQSQIDDYAAKSDDADKKRNKKEEKIAERVDTMLKSVPMWNSEECSITPAILKERNAIRELGPQ